VAAVARLSFAAPAPRGVSDFAEEWRKRPEPATDIQVTYGRRQDFEEDDEAGGKCA